MPRAQKGRGLHGSPKPPSVPYGHRNNKQNAPTSSSPLPEEQEPPVVSEEELHATIDTWNHVYLHSFMAMTDPVLQIQLEHGDLEAQWARLNRGKASMQVLDFDAFLETHDLLEYAVEHEWADRYNLAVFMHRLVMPELDADQCTSALKGFVRVFRPQLVYDASVPLEEGGGHWTIFLQLSTLIMALHASDGADLSSYRPTELIDDAWAPEYDYSPRAGPCPVKIQDAIVQSLRDIATRASDDTRQLRGIYQGALKSIIRQLKQQVLELPDPEGLELAEKLIATRNTSSTRTTTITTNNSFLTQPADIEYDSTAIWELDSLLAKNFASIMEPVASASRGLENRAVEHHDAILDVPMSVVLELSIDETQDEEEEEEEQVQKEGAGSNLPILQELPLSPGITRQSLGKSPISSVSWTPTPPPRVQDLPARMVVKRPHTLLERVERATGIASSSTKKDGEGEGEEEEEVFEDDGEEVPPPVIKKSRFHPLTAMPSSPQQQVRAPSESSSVTQEGRAGAEAEASNKGVTPPLKANREPAAIPTAAAGTSATGGSKVRRKNRAWTKAEETRLMQLVPRFQYAAQTTAHQQRPRTVRWAELKRYDEAHGNILQYRDQVMLKDKYRQKTDNGRHAGHVQELQKARSAGIPRHQFQNAKNPAL
ncbi:hypothetical protein BGZ99_004646 [Dissophora globulifera]|uniref:Uncharacterized protein n=1 Tax=Dissophora globulifera TaxID=979702 RepID=A0A9P6RJ88_9FUNG|nr:hypothetical protein BGZ99_004646 [Dissophora globulifera]